MAAHRAAYFLVQRGVTALSTPARSPSGPNHTRSPRPGTRDHGHGGKQLAGSLWGRSHPGTTGNGDRGDIHRAPGDAPFAPPVVEFVPVQHDAHEGPPTQRRDWDVIPRAAWLALARRHRPGWPRPSGAPVPDQDLIRTCDDIVQQLFAIGLAMRTIPAALQRPSGGGRPDHRAHNDLQRVIRQIHGAVLDPGPLCRGPTFGFDLMPRVRNWRDLNFYRPSPQDRYRHVDALFGEPGRNVIDWELIENHYLDVMRVVLSIQEGKISSVTLKRRLSTYSRRNNFYKAFREIGRVIRTVQRKRSTHPHGLGRGVS
jgi:hypothetical protein